MLQFSDLLKLLRHYYIFINIIINLLYHQNRSKSFVTNDTKNKYNNINE